MKSLFFLNKYISINKSFCFKMFEMSAKTIVLFRRPQCVSKVVNVLNVSVDYFYIFSSNRILQLAIHNVFALEKFVLK